MNDEAQVLFEELPATGGRKIGVARLNRPRQLNAITLTMCELLRDRLREWAADQDVVAVLLEGAGDKGFSAGGDWRKWCARFAPAGHAALSTVTPFLMSNISSIG